MKHYLVSISTLMPYPVSKDYRMEATGFGTAINRAIKLFRKDKNHKKITELTAHAIYVGNTQTIHTQKD